MTTSFTVNAMRLRLALVCAILTTSVSALLPVLPSYPVRLVTTTRRRICSLPPQHPLHMAAPRYGPPLDPKDAFPKDASSSSSAEEEEENNAALRKERYQTLIDQMLTVKDPQHIPSLLTKHMDFLLTVLTGNEAPQLTQSILDDAQAAGGPTRVEQVEQAVELTLDFCETFVQQASQIDDQNKKLLGQIIRTMSNKDEAPLARQEALDEVFSQQRSHLTAGFVRHLESECDRIARAPQMTPDSARLLETLRIIQARVVEELGQDLGEAAQVLGQLIGYETSAERLAVLQAGLTVRGVSFAHDLKDLTEEALEGFDSVAGKVDPGLIKIVQELDQRLFDYIEDHSEFE